MISRFRDSRFKPLTGRFAAGNGRWGGKGGTRPATPTPASIADQAQDFGALTLAGAGGWKPTTGGNVTGYSITGGNAAGHWQIHATTGFITPTAQGDTDDLDGGTYALTVQVTDGSNTDSATITLITTGVDGDGNDLSACYSARTMTEALAAADAIIA